MTYDHELAMAAGNNMLQTATNDKNVTFSNVPEITNISENIVMQNEDTYVVDEKEEQPQTQAGNSEDDTANMGNDFTTFQSEPTEITIEAS